MKNKWISLALSLMLLASSLAVSAEETDYDVIIEGTERFSDAGEAGADDEIGGTIEAGDDINIGEDTIDESALIDSIEEIDESDIPSEARVEADETAAVSDSEDSDSDSETAGLGVASHTIAEIVDFLKNNDVGLRETVTYAEEPDLTAPYSIGALSDQSKADALAMLNNVRYIAGLSADLTWDSDHEDAEQAAALINAVNGSLSHYPEQPDGMSDELYSLAYSGCSSSNISMGYGTLTYAIVSGWMADSSSTSNLQSVGHRRWILNPYMGKTAFGQAGSYAAMYAFDYSNTSATESAVSWPGQVMPLEYFASSTPWSLSSITVSDTSAVEVTLTRESDGAVWSFSEESADGYFYASSSSGYIVFRPSDISYSDGDVYDVTITGLDETISYTVTFFELDQYWHKHSYSVSSISWASDYLSADVTYICSCGDTYTKTHTATLDPADGLCTTSETITYTITTDTGLTSSKTASAHKYEYGSTVTDGTVTATCSVCGDTEEIGVVTAYNMWWKNTSSSSSYYYSYYSSNYTIGDQVSFWAYATAGGNDTVATYDTTYVVTSSDSTVVSVTQESTSKYGVLTMEGPGTAVITVYPALNPDLAKTYTFRVNDISYYTTSLSFTGCTYTGEAQEPAVTVNDGTADLTAGTDYTVTYSDNTNAGTASVTISGAGDYTGSVTKTFTIGEADISECTVSLSQTVFTYDGTEKTPEATVTINDRILEEESDYTAACSNHVDVGTATVTITGCGNYTGTASAAFTIEKADQTVTASATSSTIKVGETATVLASGQGTISFSSGDSSVAEVDSSTGTVTGKKAGNVTITVTAAGTENYNSSSCEVAITVTAADSDEADTTDGDTTGSGSSAGGESSSGSDSSSGSMTEDSGTDLVGTSYSDGTISYTITSSDDSGETVTVTDVNMAGSGTSSAVTVPESVEINESTYTVTAIADSAFAGNTTLKTVSIGKNITSIGTNAFKDCTSLKTVKGCASVTIIGAGAFRGCTALTTVKGMTKVTAVGSKAFYKCVKLTTIGNKASVITLANAATIGKSAFYGCKALKKVNLTSKTLTSIGANAFRGCTALKSFTAVSTKRKTIGKKAFYGDKKLSTVTLKTKKLTKSSVKANAFKGIKSTCTFRIPSSKVSAYKMIFRAKGAGIGIKVKKL